MITNFRSTSSFQWSGLTLANYTGNRVAAITEIEKRWETISMQRLEELVRLPEGWDGYTGFPVSLSNAIFAFRVLESICLPETPPPQIVPGSSGDLQIEWHTHHGDIELWIRGPNNVHAWRSVDSEDGEKELCLTTDFSDVSRWISELTESTIAVPAAA
nr:hypothetical protein [Ferrovum sp.]